MALTSHELLATARARVREESPEALRAALATARPPRLLDVREPLEFAAGALPGALNVPRGSLELRIERLARRDERLVLYCASGQRSLLAAQTLLEMGYAQVASLAGGYDRWHDAGFPVEKPEVLGVEQRERYRRQLNIPEVGEAGQLRLQRASVLLLGAGGLGSPAALYLAAAGVGTLGVVDDDVVDLSNLQRQVLHVEARAGWPKVESARVALQALNPRVRVVPMQERLTAANAERLVAAYDLVLDGGDNFPTRYLLNDTCVKLRKPNVHASVARFEGQVTTFIPGGGPCYRCLFPVPPPAELAPSCAEAGVLGVLPGVMGLLQATEALKVLLGAGEPLVGRLLTFDALSMRFRELRVERDAHCPSCAAPEAVKLNDAPQPACATPESANARP